MARPLTPKRRHLFPDEQELQQQAKIPFKFDWDWWEELKKNPNAQLMEGTQDGE